MQRCVFVREKDEWKKKRRRLFISSLKHLMNKSFRMEQELHLRQMTQFKTISLSFKMQNMFTTAKVERKHSDRARERATAIGY